jgi:hypothetical protein
MFFWSNANTVLRRNTFSSRIERLAADLPDGHFMSPNGSMRRDGN